ncbi:MAG: hypothetical protein APR54_06865 [Candidatus Cloacimonas sp. SDB]|nr:MAG: hypothetical protein APR54_06865 [Candidatus Cloacimonas sp. SDB]
MKFKIAVLVVTIMFTALNSQNARIDSLRQEMNQAEGKKRVQLMNSLAGAYRHLDLGMMRNISLEALELTKEQDLTDELIHAYNNLGRASFYNNELAVAEKMQNEKTIAYVNNNLSLIRWSFGDYGKALEYNERSYNTKQKINDETGMLNAKINAGLITMEMGNYHKAIQIFDECLEESIRLKDRTREVSALNYLGQVYLYLGSYDKSLEFMTKSLEICQQNNLETELAQVYNNFGIVHFELENFEQALKYNYSALECLKSWEMS